MIRKLSTKALIWFILLSLVSTTLFAQEQEEDESYTPEPYTDDEFAPWMHELRRAETILFGSIPLTFLFSRMVLDVVRYGSNNFDPAYAPPLFGNQTPVPLTADEKTGILISTVAVSAVVTLLDFIIGQIQKASKNKQEKQ